MTAELTDLDGVASGRAENLKEAGYESVETLTDADPAEMAEAVNYLPEDTALDLVVQAQNIIAEEDAEIEEYEPDSITEEVDEALEEGGRGEPDSESVDADEALEEEVEELEEELDEAGIDEVDEDDTISFEITFDEKLAYDTFFDSMMAQRATMLKTNRDGVETFTHALDQMRSSQGVGATIELSMSEGQLNDLHNCVRERMISYKGDNLIDHMDALKSVLNDINNVRDEHLF